MVVARCNCPLCGDIHKKVPDYSYYPSQITWRDELAWLARQSGPVWGGPLKRGEKLSDANSEFLIANGLMSQVGMEGFIISEKGIKVLKGYIKP